MNSQGRLSLYACLTLLALPLFVAPLYAQHPNYGIVTQVIDPQGGAKVTELGTGWVRLDFNWYEIEPAQGQFNWGFLDARVSEVESRGARVFATLAYGPSWAAPCQNCYPYDPQTWKSFVRAVLQRYQSHDMVFGVWNEPNFDHFLQDNGFAAYWSALFFFADQARDEVHPSARLAGPETSHHAISSNDYFFEAMQQMRRHWAPQDIVTVHWYPDGPYFPTYMDKVRDAAAGHQVWLSETGAKPCNEQYQVERYDYMLNEFVRRGRSWWTVVFMYVLHNGSWDCNYSEAIVRPDWTNYPAFDYYRNFILTHP